MKTSAALRKILGPPYRFVKTTGLRFREDAKPRNLKRRFEAGHRNWELARAAIGRGALHKQYELAAMFQRVATLKPKAVLEIGLSVGGTFATWPKLAAYDAIIVGLDLKVPVAFERKSPVNVCGQKMEIVEGDSHSPKTLELIREKFPAGIDFLFIDGDHSYEGVRRDYEMYSPLVNRGGLVMFHDIVADWRELYGRDCVEESGHVYKFWREIKTGSRSEELIDRPGQSGYGIGVIHIAAQQPSV